MKRILTFFTLISSSLLASAQTLPKPQDVNLRIFDDNIWAYDGKESPSVWKEAGIECTNEVRAPKFASLILAYEPDVIGLQERSMPMREHLNPLLVGYSEAWNIPEGEKNGTPIYYNTATTELLDAGYTLFTPEKWSNHNSKSFTWAVLKLKSCGATFITVCTHLWWKSDSAQPGSTLARASQVRLIMAEVEGLVKKYGCPVFVVGDMNSREDTIPMQQFISGGYTPCYKAATGLTDLSNGHHKCAPGTVGSRVGCDKTRSDAIDHCFIYNAGETEVRNFICDKSDEFIILTDHCPNIVDAVLK